ncbi:hypothetical protein HCN58_29690 [Bradyrhizobium sp. WSM 1791]|uniref:Uncharacterized protein n=1 Tax=Bradyrhizobium australiense TaxID=2721161 RepID=A0A7Y4GXB0_9BRAD|nr:hypothetical protein [Bradyrhizobium australiense]
MIALRKRDTSLDLRPPATWRQTWHLWTVFLPRRSITGRLVFGRVWRRHDGRHWIYKQFLGHQHDDHRG